MIPFNIKTFVMEALHAIRWDKTCPSKGSVYPSSGYAPNFILQSIRAGGHSLQLGPSYLPHTTVACNKLAPKAMDSLRSGILHRKRRLHLISVSASVEARWAGRYSSIRVWQGCRCKMDLTSTKAESQPRDAPSWNRQHRRHPLLSRLPSLTPVPSTSYW